MPPSMHLHHKPTLCLSNEMQITLGRRPVIGKRVDGSARHVRDDTLGARGPDKVTEVGGRLGAVEAEEVSTQAGDVGRGHRSPADRLL